MLRERRFPKQRSAPSLPVSACADAGVQRDRMDTVLGSENVSLARQRGDCFRTEQCHLFTIMLHLKRDL